MKSENWTETIEEKVGEAVLGFVQPAPQHQWQQFPRHFAFAFVWILLLAAGTYKLERAGVLKGIDFQGLDRWLHVGAVKTSGSVTIVEIGDKDYQGMFRGRSPLCRDGLLQLVAKVRSYGPAVIGVDVNSASDTSDSCADRDANTLAQLTAGRRSPVVWAQVTADSEIPSGLRPSVGHRRKNGEIVDELAELLGANASNFIGVSAFPIDSDGLVRRYVSQFPVVGPSARGTDERADSTPTIDPPSASLARLLVDRSRICDDSTTVVSNDAHVRVVCPIPDADKEPVAFNFYGDRYRFPVLSAGEIESAGPSSTADRSDLVNGKIVLIGATFEGSGDFYPTPIGRMSRVELTALAVQSVLSGGGIRSGKRWQEAFASVLAGSLIVLIFFAWAGRPVHAFVISLIAVSAAAIFCSVILYNTSAYIFDFIPIATGMILQQALTLAQRAGYLANELQTRANDVQQLSREKQILNDKLALTNLMWESRERDRERAKPRDSEVRSKAQGAGGRS